MKWIERIFKMIAKRQGEKTRAASQIMLDECIVTIEELALLIRQARYDFSPMRLTHEEYDEYDLFEANSTLYQADRLVNKIREYILILQSYEMQFSDSPDILKKMEFMNAHQAGLECYHTMIHLILLFQKLTKEKGKRLSNEFISQAQALELKCSGLRQATWLLNQFVMHYELKLQLNKLSEISALSGLSEKLKLKAKEVTQEQDYIFLISLINIFDGLNRVNIMTRNKVIKRTFEGIYVNIDLLISEFSKSDYQKHTIFSILYGTFNQIESLQFSAGRRNRWSRELFENARQAKRELRKTCTQHPVGKAFLDEVVFYTNLHN